jgi:hypothetical protein
MTTQPEILKTGDKIVPLAALATQCAAFSGASSLGTVLERAGVPGHWVLAGVFLGALAGLLVGWGFGHIAFPASASNVFVVKAGRATLPKTLFATFVPSLVVGTALALVVVVVVGTPSVVAALAWAAGCSASVACFFGFGSALA